MNVDKESDQDTAPDINSIILVEYLTQYTPAKSCGSGVMVKSTSDIISDLADMADLSHHEVNAIMIGQGFRPGRRSSGPFGWLMRHSEV